jgi:5-methylcytosine-specific restriction endonuclease McrA
MVDATRYAADPESRRIHTRNWNKANPEMKAASDKKTMRKIRLLKPEHLSLRGARYRAKLKGVACTITKEQLAEKYQATTNCPICGVKLAFNTGKALNDSPSRDRLNVKLGYTDENTFIICRGCNSAKSNSTPAQLRAIADFMEQNDPMWLEVPQPSSDRPGRSTLA